MTYIVFDVVYVDGENAMVLTYVQRRRLLEELDLACLAHAVGARGRRSASTGWSAMKFRAFPDWP